MCHLRGKLLDAKGAQRRPNALSGSSLAKFDEALMMTQSSEGLILRTGSRCGRIEIGPLNRAGLRALMGGNAFGARQVDALVKLDQAQLDADRR